MNKEEIIKKAIQKAIDNGWRPVGIDVEHPLAVETITSMPLELVVFNKDFTKALWGEELHHETFIVPKELSKRFAGTTDLSVKPIWQYHLQQIVIADDPIAYLGDNL